MLRHQLVKTDTTASEVTTKGGIEMRLLLLLLLSKTTDIDDLLSNCHIHFLATSSTCLQRDGQAKLA